MSFQYTRDLSCGLTGKYAVVAHRLRPGCSILELGCSTGHFAKALSERGHRVVGVELDAEAARHARGEGLDIRHGDIEQRGMLEALTGPFDAVLAMDVLEHLRDPARVLQRLKALLRPDGQLLCTGPNVAYWAIRKELLLGRWGYTDAGIMDRTHLHFYTASTWKELLEGNGYRVKCVEPAEGMIPFEGYLLRVPGLRRIVGPLQRAALRLQPQLFAIVFLIEARPAEVNDDLSRG